MEIELVTLSDLENLKKEILSEIKKMLSGQREEPEKNGLNQEKYSSFWAFLRAPFKRSETRLLFPLPVWAE